MNVIHELPKSSNNNNDNINNNTNDNIVSFGQQQQKSTDKEKFQENYPDQETKEERSGSGSNKSITFFVDKDRKESSTEKEAGKKESVKATTVVDWNELQVEKEKLLQ